MAILLLDTSVIIDVLNNKRNRATLLMDLVRAGHVLACCPINITEVYAGLRPKEETAAEELFASLQQLPITPPAARMAGEFKRTLHAFECLVGISQTPERERRPAMTRNSRILAIGGDQADVLLRII